MNLGYEDVGVDYYQHEASQTAIYPENAKVTYPILGLAGEAGEVAGKYSKVIRDGNGEISPERKQQILDELGDVLWFLAQTATDLEVDLSTIAQNNLKKLAS